VLKPCPVRREAITLLELLERRIIKGPHPFIRPALGQSGKQHSRTHQEDEEEKLSESA
jgi:hypothetical protein